MPLCRFIKQMLVAPVHFFSGKELYGGNLIVSVGFVLTFFIIWTIAVQNEYNVALNCSIGQTQKTTEGLATLILRKSKY